MNGHRCPPPLSCPSSTPPFSTTLGHSWRRTLFNYRLHKIADAAAVVEPQRKKSINCRLWAWASRVMVYNRFKQRHYGDLSLPLRFSISLLLSLSLFISLCALLNCSLDADKLILILIQVSDCRNCW